MLRIASKRRLIFLGFGAVALIAAGLGAMYEASAKGADSRRHPPPGRLFLVGTQRLHLHCIGEGAPTVVMEAGLGEQSLTWSLVQRPIATMSRSCSYDRAGYGWSEPGPQPRSPANAADELHRLLASAGETGPYVLVAHSLGAYVAKVFVNRHPAEIAAVVLIEPTDEEAATLAGTPRIPIIEYRLFAFLARLGVVRLFGSWLVPLIAGTDPPDDVLANAPVIYSHRSLQTAADELKASVEGARRLAASPFILRHVRLVVIAAEETGDSVHTKRLTRLSTRGTHLIVEKSGHYVQYDRPDVVVNTIRQVINEIRSRRDFALPDRR